MNKKSAFPFSLVAIFFAIFAFLPMRVCAGADDLNVARQALRDGLWDVARTHASRVDSMDAKLLILESFARENRWADAQKKLDDWGEKTTPAFLYYRALIQFKLGHRENAEEILASVDFTNTPFNLLASRLRVRVALSRKDFATAERLAKNANLAQAADDESRMVAADVFAATGNLATAEKIWRELVAKTNASERVFVVSSVNLADAALLRHAYARTKDVTLRRLAGVRLGHVLIAKNETFTEGENLIRALAKDSPDADGVREAFVALADAFLFAKNYQAASDTFRDALEIWPPLALHAHMQESRGWAFRALGKTDDAFAAFVRAEETATNDVTRATAILEQGDVLSESGRGEEALAKYRLVLEKYPNTPAGEKLKVIVELRELEAKGRDYYRNYDFARAQSIFAMVAERDPSRKSRMAYYDVLCLYGQGLDQEAHQRARELATTSENFAIRADATMWLAKFLFNRRRWKESRKYFETYAKMKPEASDAPTSLLWASRAAFADHDYEGAIQLVSRLADEYAASNEKVRGYLMQGEALIELARFDEAILVLERVMTANEIPREEKIRAQILRADALFAMGADNPARYQGALAAYQAIRQRETVSPSLKISIAFKMSRTLEKLKRLDEAIDQYYSSVVLAYREGRLKGEQFDDEARAAFSRAAFRLADEYESRGKDFQAMHILELVVASDVPAAAEAEKRIDRIQAKGKFL